MLEYFTHNRVTKTRSIVVERREVAEPVGADLPQVSRSAVEVEAQRRRKTVQRRRNKSQTRRRRNRAQRRWNRPQRRSQCGAGSCSDWNSDGRNSRVRDSTDEHSQRLFSLHTGFVTRKIQSFY